MNDADPHLLEVLEWLEDYLREQGYVLRTRAAGEEGVVTLAELYRAWLEAVPHES